jgi:hypothetical protein
MPPSHAFRRFADAAEKWRALIERRRAHILELHSSGRWKHYYTHAQFLSLLQECVRLTVLWKRMAPRPGDEQSIESENVAGQQGGGTVPEPPHRTAA